MKKKIYEKKGGMVGMSEVKYNVCKLDIEFAKAYFAKTFSTELSEDELSQMSNIEKFRNL